MLPTGLGWLQNCTKSFACRISFNSPNSYKKWVYALQIKKLGSESLGFESSPDSYLSLASVQHTEPRFNVEQIVAAHLKLMLQSFQVHTMF